MLKSFFRVALQWFRRLFVRVTLYAVVALTAVAVSVMAGIYLPEALVGIIGPESLKTILTLLGSSMLAVTTFSLSILSSSYQFTAANITPRSRIVLSEDTTTHSVLATFIGAFLFSLTCILLMATPWITDAAVFLLFCLTVLIAAQVIVAMIRWINHIELISGYEGVINQVHSSAMKPIRDFARSPALKCNVLEEGASLLDEEGYVLRARSDGYVQQILETALQEHADEHELRILLLVQPGAFVTKDGPLASVLDGGELEDETVDDLHDCFLLRDGRTFLQDPEFGLIVLTEIGVRALSPGVNDPQTAVDVINRISAALQRAAPPDKSDAIKDVEHDRVWMMPVPLERLYASSLEVLARYVDGEVELERALADAYRRLGNACNSAGQKAAQESAGRLPFSIAKLRNPT